MTTASPTMKAVVLTDFDTSPVVREDVPAPAPADGDLLVRVRASSANPVDNAIAAGMLKGIADYEFPGGVGPRLRRRRRKRRLRGGPLRPRR